MSRFLQQAVSCFTMIGYWLVVTWGPVWHDHHHCHAHSQDGETVCAAEIIAGHSHPHCCSHHHSKCDEPHSTEPSGSPCHSPLHDDHCPVCQILAHPPLAAPEVAVVDVSVPVEEFVASTAPLVECWRFVFMTPAARRWFDCQIL